jgi:PadR family transcriptional regulator, regulatory protein PadR
MRAEALKGHLDGLLLAVLEAGPAHGYAVIEALRSASGGTFDLPTGTVYPALRRLEEDGLVSSEWREPVGERRRRIYRLTAKGTKTLAAQRESWKQFAGAVSAVMSGERAWAPAT